MRAIGLIAAAAALAATPVLADEAKTVKVSLTEWSLGFEEVTVEGEAATFEITNDGTAPHAFEIEGEIGGEEFEVAVPLLAPGESTAFTVELPAGTYEVYCPVSGHDDRGMEGKVTFAGEM